MSPELTQQIRVARSRPRGPSRHVSTHTNRRYRLTSVHIGDTVTLPLLPSPLTVPVGGVLGTASSGSQDHIGGLMDSGCIFSRVQGKGWGPVELWY